jgi:hypothetical protein
MTLFTKLVHEYIGYRLGWGVHWYVVEIWIWGTCHQTWARQRYKLNCCHIIVYVSVNPAERWRNASSCSWSGCQCPNSSSCLRNMNLLAVPLSQIRNNAKVCWGSEILEFMTLEVPLNISHLQVYGPVISGIPNLLSKFSLDVISDWDAADPTSHLRKLFTC